jgi:hypothetical protein
MSKTALVDALKACDVDRVRTILEKRPDLKELHLGRGFNLLQFCCSRPTADNPDKAARQVRLAKWLVARGFDPRVLHTTAAGEDGEAEPTEVSLVFFAVARAQNNRLARYFLEQGAKPSALFAAAWWGNAAIVKDLVAHGADLNEVVGATPLHMAVAVLDRGTAGKPALAKARLKLLTEMLRLGANPNIAAFDGTTPLRTALDKGYDLAVFKLLLNHGADPDVPGKDGRTVRDLAARKRDRRYHAALKDF